VKVIKMMALNKDFEPNDAYYHHYYYLQFTRGGEPFRLSSFLFASRVTSLCCGDRLGLRHTKRDRKLSN
jgi:hypothetical protein